VTAAELFDTDADFRALLQCWIDNRRCPLPMADYLRERGLEGQAEAAEWAAWGVRQVSGDGVEMDVECYCFVRYSEFTSWWWALQDGRHQYSDERKPDNYIPTILTPENNKPVFTGPLEQTIPTALLWLLDRWAEVKAAGVELPKVEAGVVTN
jgi:hypothetical protein